jgi:hypothetical protein
MPPSGRPARIPPILPVPRSVRALPGAFQFRRHSEIGADASPLGAAEMRALAGRWEGLAAEQAALGRRQRRLCLRRSAPSTFEITDERIAESITGLRRAARSVRAGRPEPSPAVAA